MKIITDENVLKWQKCALHVFNTTKFSTAPDGSWDATTDMSAVLELDQTGWEIWVRPMQPSFLKLYKKFQKKLPAEMLQMVEINFSTASMNEATADYLELLEDYRAMCEENIEMHINKVHVKSALSDIPAGSSISLRKMLEEQLGRKKASIFADYIKVQAPEEIRKALRWLLPIYDDYDATIDGPATTLDNFIRGIAAQTLKENIDKKTAKKLRARETEEGPAPKPAKRELL